MGVASEKEWFRNFQLYCSQQGKNWKKIKYANV